MAVILSKTVFTNRYLAWITAKLFSRADFSLSMAGSESWEQKRWFGINRLDA